MSPPFQSPLQVINPKGREMIRQMASDLFTSDAETSNKTIEDIVTIAMHHVEVMPNMQTFGIAAAEFFDAAISCLLDICRPNLKANDNFFCLINHLPVLETSPFYTQTLDILGKFFRLNPKMIKLFDKLQLLYLYNEIGFADAAATLVEELETSIPQEPISFYAMYQLGKYKSYSSTKEMEQRARLLLQATAKINREDCAESAIYLMLRWISSLEWIKGSPLYKDLLFSIFERIETKHNLSTMLVAYELFSLDNKMVNPEQKMKLFNHLISYPVGMLNPEQLHALHFFAGNYSSGYQDRFQNSIEHYKQSNYYLHKCWERLIGISRYLRAHSSITDYKLAMNHLELEFSSLSNQTSLRNNSYVDNLKANFVEIQKLYCQVGELSITDPLTCLKNRRFMDQNLLQFVALASRHQTPVCFVMMDIDHFKNLNDTHGHAAGDLVLHDLAAMLKKGFRKSDVIIRYGGEEFLAVLFDATLDKSVPVVENFLQEVREHVFMYQDTPLKITISAGIYCEVFGHIVDCSELDSFIGKADIALYKAKKAGRDCVQIYKDLEILT